MSRENISNFASTTLATTIANTNTTPTFTVQAGTGISFPTVDASLNPQWMIIAIDTELIICSQRAGDVFTIAARGAEGTALSAHGIGAPVTLGFTAGMLDRIWQKLPDTYNPDVPPYIWAGTTPSTWDDEFEGSSGLWTMYPYPSPQNFDFSSSHPSCFSFQRANYDSTTYWLYKPFSPGTGKWQVTTKLSHSCNYYLANNANFDVALLISDLSNPTGSLDAGNNVHLSSIYNNSNQFNFNFSQRGVVATQIRVVAAAFSNSGTGILDQWAVDQGSLYFRIAYNGSGSFAFFIGDGYTYRLMSQTNKTLNLANGSIGFRFNASNATGVASNDSAVIDWLRVELANSQSF